MGHKINLKIDAFCHIIPLKFKDIAFGTGEVRSYQRQQAEMQPGAYDLDHRRRILDKYEGAMQVLTLAARAYGRVAAANKTKEIELARLANDTMAEIVFQYPDYFAAAVATLPLGDIDAALQELDRAVKVLKFRGIEIHAPLVNHKWDSPEFDLIYQKMCQYDLPILIHPWQPVQFISEEKPAQSEGVNFNTEMSNVMMRLTNAGIMHRYPDLKVLIHHGGGGIPYFRNTSHLMEMVLRQPYNERINKPPIEYLKKFYLDTATLSGSGMQCCYAFCGPEKLLYATDYPYDAQWGDAGIRENLNDIEDMQISDAEKKMILEDNARKLFKLPV